MSRESMEWLNSNVVKGNTQAYEGVFKGAAWWRNDAYNKSGRPSHYEGPVPVEVVENLFDFTFETAPVQYQTTVINEDGVSDVTLTDPSRKVVFRSDTKEVTGVFSNGYTPPDYKSSMQLIQNVIGTELSVHSAGLLKGGAEAWVQVTRPEASDVQGVKHFPFLLWTDSANGTISQTLKNGTIEVVCDNTRSAALAEKSAQFKIKHTKYANAKVLDIRAALDILIQVETDFTNEVNKLLGFKISDEEFEQFLEATAPFAPEDASKRAATMAETKRDTLWRLWSKDERVTPWKNTAFGVVQAVNTYAHHEGIVRGASREERNFEKMVKDQFADVDTEALKVLRKVTKRELALV